MKKIKISYFLLVAISMCMVSCNENSSSELPEHSFDKVHSVITNNTTDRYDIQPKPEFVIDLQLKTLKAGYTFNVFNYGGEIRFVPTCIDNCLIDNIAPICHYYIIQKTQIRGLVEKNSKEYGQYGVARSLDFALDLFPKNVIISPLALKHIQDEDAEDSDCLVYVIAQHPSEKLYLDYIFLGNYITRHIIEEQYNDVETTFDLSCGIGLAGSEFKDFNKLINP